MTPYGKKPKMIAAVGSFRDSLKKATGAILIGFMLCMTAPAFAEFDPGDYGWTFDYMSLVDPESFDSPKQFLSATRFLWHWKQKQPRIIQELIKAAPAIQPDVAVLIDRATMGHAGERITIWMTSNGQRAVTWYTFEGDEPKPSPANAFCPSDCPHREAGKVEPGFVAYIAEHLLKWKQTPLDPIPLSDGAIPGMYFGVVSVYMHGRHRQLLLTWHDLFTWHGGPLRRLAEEAWLYQTKGPEAAAAWRQQGELYVRWSKALRNNDVAAVRALLAEPDARAVADKEGAKWLVGALERGQTQVAAVLIEAELDAGFGRALHVAVGKGQTRIMHLLLAHGAE